MKMGRPKIANSEKKQQLTGVRLNKNDRKLIEDAATIKGQNLSSWIRETLIKTAQKQISNNARETGKSTTN